jgi:hypothetical protein
MSHCCIINLNYLHILLSTQASQSLKVCSLKQVFTILNVISFISLFFLKTRHMHYAYPCNLYKRHFLQQNYIRARTSSPGNTRIKTVSAPWHYQQAYIIKIIILSVHLTLILNLNSLTQYGIIQAQGMQIKAPSK